MRMPLACPMSGGNGQCCLKLVLRCRAEHRHRGVLGDNGADVHRVLREGADLLAVQVQGAEVLGFNEQLNDSRLCMPSSVA